MTGEPAAQQHRISHDCGDFPATSARSNKSIGLMWAPNRHSAHLRPESSAAPVERLPVPAGWRFCWVWCVGHV